MTLFATHYFELTLLAAKLPHAKNLHLSAREHDDRIIFLYAVDEGPANQSYGLQVAKLAGVPKTVLSIAEARLMQLEQTGHAAATTPHTTPDASLPGPLQSDLFTPKPKHERTIHALLEIDPDQLTPREALETLYLLKDGLEHSD